MYKDLLEDTVSEVNEKLGVAMGYAETFGPSMRPGLRQAAKFWDNEVERLTKKIKSLFEI